MTNQSTGIYNLKFSRTNRPLRSSVTYGKKNGTFAKLLPHDGGASIQGIVNRKSLNDSSRNIIKVENSFNASSLNINYVPNTVNIVPESATVSTSDAPLGSGIASSISGSPEQIEVFQISNESYEDPDKVEVSGNKSSFITSSIDGYNVQESESSDFIFKPKRKVLSTRKNRGKLDNLCKNSNGNEDLKMPNIAPPRPTLAKRTKSKACCPVNEKNSSGLRSTQSNITTRHGSPSKINSITDFRSMDDLRATGENRRFFDEISYLVDGIVQSKISNDTLTDSPDFTSSTKNIDLKMRQSSLVELSEKCVNADFLRNFCLTGDAGRVITFMCKILADKSDFICSTAVSLLISIISKGSSRLAEGVLCNAQVLSYLYANLSSSGSRTQPNRDSSKREKTLLNDMQEIAKKLQISQSLNDLTARYMAFYSIHNLIASSDIAIRWTPEIQNWFLDIISPEGELFEFLHNLLEAKDFETCVKLLQTLETLSRKGPISIEKDEILVSDFEKVITDFASLVEASAEEQTMMLHMSLVDSFSKFILNITHRNHANLFRQSKSIDFCEIIERIVNLLCTNISNSQFACNYGNDATVLAFSIVSTSLCNIINIIEIEGLGLLHIYETENIRIRRMCLSFLALQQVAEDATNYGTKPELLEPSIVSCSYFALLLGTLLQRSKVLREVALKNIPLNSLLVVLEKFLEAHKSSPTPNDQLMETLGKIIHELSLKN